jgi:hypothetical protein
MDFFPPDIVPFLTVFRSCFNERVFRYFVAFLWGSVCLTDRRCLTRLASSVPMLARHVSGWAVFQSEPPGLEVSLQASVPSLADPYLTLEAEKDFLAGFFDAASRGSVLVVSEAWKSLEEKLGHEVAETTVYRMLARHGGRKIMPRRKHPKNSESFQEDVKNTSKKG